MPKVSEICSFSRLEKGIRDLKRPKGFREADITFLRQELTSPDRRVTILPLTKPDEKVPYGQEQRAIRS